MAPTVLVIAPGHGLGTGVILHQDGHNYAILTGKHVVDELKIVFVEIAGKRYPAKVIKESYDRDLALLYVKAPYKQFHTARLCEKPGERFDEVWSVGAGLGSPIFPTKGVLSNRDWHFTKNPDMLVPEIQWYQHSAAIAPGNSGGPLYTKQNGHYCVVGINLRGYIGTDVNGFPLPVSQFNFALSLEEINKFFEAKYGWK